MLNVSMGQQKRSFRNKVFIKLRIKSVQTPRKMKTYFATLQQSFMYTNV